MVLKQLDLKFSQVKAQKVMHERAAEAIEFAKAMQRGSKVPEKRHKTAQQIPKRARVIRLAASGQAAPVSERMVGVNRNSANPWRKR